VCVYVLDEGPLQMVINLSMMILVSNLSVKGERRVCVGWRKLKMVVNER